MIELHHVVNYNEFTRVTFDTGFAAIFVVLFLLLLYKLCYLYFEVIDIRIVSNRRAGLVFLPCLLAVVTLMYGFCRYYWYCVHLLYRL
jgi:hypothetical protein